MRMVLGVTSRYSSLPSHSIACSRVRMRGGSRRTAASDEAAGGHEELEPEVSAAAIESRAGDHVLHLALALANVLDNRPGVVLRHIDDDVLDRLGKDVGDALEDDLGPRDLELETLAPH